MFRPGLDSLILYSYMFGPQMKSPCVSCTSILDGLNGSAPHVRQVFGVADKFGSIEVGKVANLVMTTGDLLEARTDTKALFIDGRPVPLSTKHTYMFDMFKARP